MRLTYYRFPEGTADDILVQNGCAIVLKNGGTIYKDFIPEDKRDLIEYIEDTIFCTVSAAKKLIRQYGGTAWTEHIDRYGSCFEVTPIVLEGNNSRFKYNHHL